MSGRDLTADQLTNYMMPPAPTVAVTKSTWRRLVFQVLLAVVLIALIEGMIEVIYHPTFWQKTPWLMHDPYRGELFDRNELYIRLNALQDSDPDIISVGDSSGFFSLQSTVVNRYTGNWKFLSLNTGANQAFVGYQGIAEYMLRRSKKIKYVVLYIYPQLLPQEEVIRVADLGPITYDALASAKSYATPPSTFLSPYAKRWLFEGERYHAGAALSNHLPSLQLASTVNESLGWLPEFDQRYDRVDGRAPFYPDTRTSWYHRLGFGDPSAINANLAEFESAVRRYGARLVVAFAPVSERAIVPGDPNVSIADQALARFQREHPDVKFLFPLITRWGSEKFGMYNHISREFTHLSSERLGKGLSQLIQNPRGIAPYTIQSAAIEAYKPVQITPVGPPDPALLAPSLALYLYTSTGEPRYSELFSTRVKTLLAEESSFQYAMVDAKKRLAALEQKHVKIGFDLSQMRATPVNVTGLRHCGPASGLSLQWVQLDGVMIFTYDSPVTTAREPVAWPHASRILVPTVTEDGKRKFDGYCLEPSLHDTVSMRH